MSTNVIVKQDRINDKIPVLICYKEDFLNIKTMILYHAFLQSKEYVLNFAYKFAQMGYVAVSIDLNRHGERDNVSKRFPWQEFYNTMFESAQEITEVLDHLEKNHYINCQDVTVLGVSLGGLTAFAASMIDDRIANIATILASANFSKLARVKKSSTLKRFFSDNLYDQEAFLKNVDELSLLYDPYKNIEKLKIKNLLMVNGTVDLTIPTNLVKEFQVKIKEKYVGLGNHLKFVHVVGAGHEVSKDMFEEVLSWGKSLIDD